MARENPTRTPAGFLTFIGGLVLLGIFAFIVISWVRANGATDEVSTRRAASRVATRNELTKKYQTQLGTAGWTDKAKGVAHIPVADAMKLTLVELQSKKVGASTVKVEPPLPVVTPDPNATEPPPPSLPSAPGGAQTMRFESLAASSASQPGTGPATPTAPGSNTAVPAPDTPAKTTIPRTDPTQPAIATPPVSVTPATPAVNPGAAPSAPPQSKQAPPPPLNPVGVAPAPPGQVPPAVPSSAPPPNPQPVPTPAAPPESKQPAPAPGTPPAPQEPAAAPAPTSQQPAAPAPQQPAPPAAPAPTPSEPASPAAPASPTNPATPAP